MQGPWVCGFVLVCFVCLVGWLVGLFVCWFVLFFVLFGLVGCLFVCGLGSFCCLLALVCINLLYVSLW